MTRVKMIDPKNTEDPEVQGILQWVTEMEGAVPNHFLVEMNFPEYFKAKLGSSKVLWELGELSMEEIQHIGILVSRANGCPYCTAAFCTILNYGLKADESYVSELLAKGIDVVKDERLLTILKFCLQVNDDPAATTDANVAALKSVGLTDRGVVQVVHIVSDFGSYNRLNLALNTDYDYKAIWQTAKKA